LKRLMTLSGYVRSDLDVERSAALGARAPAVFRPAGQR
jgi:hypothetical protein